MRKGLTPQAPRRPPCRAPTQRGQCDKNGCLNDAPLGCGVGGGREGGGASGGRPTTKNVPANRLPGMDSRANLSARRRSMVSGAVGRRLRCSRSGNSVAGKGLSYCLLSARIEKTELSRESPRSRVGVLPAGRMIRDRGLRGKRACPSIQTTVDSAWPAAVRRTPMRRGCERSHSRKPDTSDNLRRSFQRGAQSGSSFQRSVPAKEALSAVRQ
jgi:hypothetical protein